MRETVRPLEVPPAPAAPRRAPRWPGAAVAAAGLLGAAGVGIGAAGAHLGGGDLTRTASEFLLVHAAALAALSGLGTARPDAPVLILPAGLLAAGAALFGGDLAFAGLLGWRPVPLAAPMGGLCLIAGWLALAVAGVALSRRRP